LRAIKAANLELSWRRELGKKQALQEIVERLPMARSLREAKRAPHPARKVPRSVTRFSHPELAGETLVPERLTPEEAAELDKLVKRKLAVAFEEGAEPLSVAEGERYEMLVGQAAGNAALFTEKRKEAAAREKLDALKEARKVASLEKRPKWEEPGSVTLPRFAVHDWLLSETNRGGDSWSVANIGALAVLLSMFENENARLIANARLETVEGDPVLVIAGGVGAGLRFSGAVGGSPLGESESGFVKLRPALRTLQRNEWLVIEQSVSEIRVRLGPRALELKKPKTTT